MKSYITWRELKERYPVRIKCGYCALYWFLYGIEPDYYHTGHYGWDADIYVIDSQTVIVTGYRPRGNYELDRQFIATIENMAHNFYRTHTKKLINQRQAIKDYLKHHNVVKLSL